MGLFGSILGGALGVGASIFGGISASKAIKKAKGMLEDQKQDYTDWYNRNYNEDSTQRADAQRVLTNLNENIRNRNRQAAGQQAVMGGTEESVAAAKAANSQALADATSQIAVAGEARKERVESKYMQAKDDIDERLRNLEIGKANAIGQAVGGVAQAGADMAGLF